MKVYKPFIAAALAAAVTVLPLTGCSVSEFLWNDDYEYEYVEPEPTEPVDSVTVSDPEEIYDEIEYIPEMFYGSYVADGISESDPKSLVDPVAFSKGKEKRYSPNNDGIQFTALPYRIDVGPHTNQTDLQYIPNYNWLTMYVVSKDGEQRGIEGAFTIKGSNIEILQIASKNIDPETKQFSYQLTSNPIVLHYEFNGNDLTLSHGLTESVTLHAEGVKLDSTTDTMTGISVTDSNLVPGSDSIQGITSLSLKNDSGAILEGEEAYPATVKFGKDGLCELEWNNKKSKLIYFYGGADGLVFSDGKKNYLYTARSYDLYGSSLPGGASDASQYNNLTEEQKDEIASLSDQLYAELRQAFTDAGLNVQIEENEGLLTLNSVKLFEFAHSDLTAEGLDYVNRFLSAFAPVVCSGKYDSIITGIVIEGHTDTKGSNVYNQTLSENRAASVLSYCLSPESGLSPEIIEKLTPMVASMGFSSRVPILNEDGSVNDEASRRVVFHLGVINQQANDTAQ